MNPIADDLTNLDYMQASELWYNSELNLKHCVELGDEAGALKALDELKEAVEQRFSPILKHEEIVTIFLGIIGGILHFACRDAGLPPAYLTMMILYQKETLTSTVMKIPHISMSHPALIQGLNTCISQACRLIQNLSLSECSPLTRRCISFIQHKLTDKLTVEELAGILGVTRQYLSARFKEETGRSLTDYINWQRITLSKYYLRQKSLTITQVAMMCGYSDSNYFGRTFKKLEHMTPREYIAKHGNTLYGVHAPAEGDSHLFQLL